MSIQDDADDMMTKRRNDTQHYDIQHNGIQPYDTHHKGLIRDIQHK